MKILISHRGNLEGRNPDLENSPDQIIKCIEEGYDVEIDVWKNDQGWFLGHDEPQYSISSYFLFNGNLWCHAKNYEALVSMLEMDIHCFWHEKDMVTITSEGYIWAYPGFQPLKNSIAVMPEINKENVSDCLGVCSDYIRRYREQINDYK